MSIDRNPTHRRGDILALRFRRNHPADLIAPVRLVEHGPERTILFLHCGSPLKIRADADGNRIGVDGPLVEREARIARLIDGEWTDNHTLMIHEPHRLGAVWLFWRATDWAFQGYYVNMQAPLEASSAGFDTADYLLDVVVEPDLSWRWKDEDEVAEALEAELIPPVLLHAVRADARRFIHELEGRRWPFGQGLETWRPDPGWGIPELPSGWDEGLMLPLGR